MLLQDRLGNRGLARLLARYAAGRALAPVDDDRERRAARIGESVAAGDRVVTPAGAVVFER
jgi:hypothetical protein